VRSRSEAGQDHGLRGPTSQDGPEIVEEAVRLWVAGLDRLRQETILPDGRTDAVIVVDGDRWWFFNPRRGVLRHDGGDSHSVGTFDIASFLDPSVLIPHLDFGSIRPDDAGERPCWLVTATPRAIRGAQRRRGSPLPEGADHYRLWIDQERGVALRIEASWQAEPFSVREATGVLFDSAMPEELFALQPPADVPVFSTRDELEVRDVSVAEVARIAPFTVLVPSRLPAGMTLGVVRYAPGSAFSGSSPSVLLLARAEPGPGGYVSIEETTVSHAEGDRRDWQKTQRGGVIYSTSEVGGKRIVSVDKHGIRVQLSGSLELAALVDIAESLQSDSGAAADPDGAPR
jgi:outer membrane lipoprotein-sorting protein